MVTENVIKFKSRQPKTKELVLVAVTTASKFLRTRAIAVNNTWARSIPGKVIFFGPENAPLIPDLPLVRLKGVNDSYPARKKSFYTIKYIHDHYKDDFHFFMRVDDDVQVRGENLLNLLSSVSNTLQHFLILSKNYAGCNFTKVGMELAERLQLTGWIKNARTGNIIGRAQGTKQNVDTM